MSLGVHSEDPGRSLGIPSGGPRSNVCSCWLCQYIDVCGSHDSWASKVCYLVTYLHVQSSGSTTFIQYVLIPEVVSMLISEDMNVTLEEAVRIWDESREFGLRAFPDELDEE